MECKTFFVLVLWFSYWSFFDSLGIESSRQSIDKSLKTELSDTSCWRGLGVRWRGTALSAGRTPYPSSVPARLSIFQEEPACRTDGWMDGWMWEEEMLHSQEPPKGKDREKGAFWSTKLGDGI